MEKSKKSRKAQVTLFVVIAVLLVAGVVVVLSLRGKMPQKVAPEIMPIISFVQGCVESTAEEGLIFIGRQGGYYELPEESIDTYVYYFASNKSYLPAKEKIEQQISLYVNEMLPFCTKNFVDFPDFSVESQAKKVSTKTIILEGKIRLKVSYPIEIEKGGTAFKLEEFGTEIPSRLNTIYDASENITAEQLQNPPSICLSCLTALAVQHDFYIDMANYGSDTVIFTLRDNQTPINNQPYDWVFANKY